MEKHLISRSEAVARIAQRANRSLENPDLTPAQAVKLSMLTNVAQLAVFFGLEPWNSEVSRFIKVTEEQK
jgi:hypothetical protein